MNEIIYNVIELYGTMGVFFLICIENVFPPIPSEVLLTFSGFMTTKTDISLPEVILAATIGSLVGGLILYFFGTRIDAAHLCKFVNGKGKFLGVSESDITSTMEKYEKGQDKAVFLCRMVPILRSLISIPAGMAHMSLPKFCLLTAVGSFCWNTILCVAGAFMGDAWQLLLDYTGFYSSVLMMIAFSTIGIVIAKKVLGKSKKS